MKKIPPLEDYLEINHEVESITAEIHTYVTGKLKTSEHYNNWYAGITGEKDEDGDGKADRIVAHRNDFTDLDESTWEEWEVSSVDVAMEIEERLNAAGLDIGEKINPSKEPAKVYTFRKIAGQSE